MKKIYSPFISILLAIPLACSLLFYPLSVSAATEADNLEAWAKMYEDMNQASGGEIEKLMKEMEQSGELEALMKELEQSGELDNIIDAMIKSTPQEFMENLEQEVQKEYVPAQEPIQTPEPLVATKTPTPVTPILQVDKSKLKQVQALLNSIVSKIASIRQKAATRTAVQRELNPWEYILNDLTYYLTTIQDENLAKYLQLPEFSTLYNNLVSLNANLSVEEPRLQVEEMLDVEFIDPYLVLGFSTSNVSKAEAEKRYTELAAQKNPFAIKDKLKRQGIPPAEVEAQFKTAQKEYNDLFDAYKRIEQKETSSQAFLAILQALHTSVYKHLILEDAKKLLGKFDPEALKIKEAQEAKEKEARDYRARVASQRPEFIPPIFDWPSFGDKRAERDTSSKNKGSGGFEPRVYPDFDRNAGRIPGLTSQEAKEQEKGKGGKKDEKGKKDNKAKDGKKDGKKDDKGKDGKDKKPEEKSSNDLAPIIKNELLHLKGNLQAAGIGIDKILPQPAPNLSADDDRVYLTQIKLATQKAMDISKAIAKDVETLGKLKEKKDEELKKYYEAIEKTLNDTIISDATLKTQLEKLFAVTDTNVPPSQFSAAQKNAYFGIGAGTNTVNNIENFQKELTNLAITSTDSHPAEVKSILKKATEAAAKNSNALDYLLVGGTVNPRISAAFEEIGKQLEAANKKIETSKNKPAIKLVSNRYNKAITKVVNEGLIQDADAGIIQEIAALDPRSPTRRNGDQIAVSAVDQDNLRKLNAAYNKLGIIAETI